MGDDLNRRVDGGRGRGLGLRGAQTGVGLFFEGSVRSISVGPPAGFIFNVRRLEAGEPARNAARAPSRLSGVSGVMITASSSPSSLRTVAPSAVAEISCTRGDGVESPRRSRISRAREESRRLLRLLGDVPIVAPVSSLTGVRLGFEEKPARKRARRQDCRPDFKAPCVVLYTTTLSL